MKRVMYTGLAVMLAVAALPQASDAATISINIFASSAPNAFGSPSWPGYVTNAIAGIQAGGAPVTNGNPPSDYSSATVFTSGDVIVTDYNSWKGQVNPPPPFDQEYGNRLHFGLDAIGDGMQLSLAQLNFAITSSDGNSLGFAGSFDGTDNYSAARVGILYGFNGVKGGGDDVFITSGSASQLVDELVYVGVGNAFCSGQPAACGGSPFQSIQEINDYIAANAPLSVTGQYFFTAGEGGAGATIASNSATVQVNAVPEPASVILLGTGLFGAGYRRFRGKKR